MKITKVYGEGSLLPAVGDYAIAKAERLWLLGWTTENNSTLWRNKNIATKTLSSVFISKAQRNGEY